jgi:hypothetical protein
MVKLSNTDKILIGHKLAEVLMLREDKGYNPIRYKTLWGNKTDLGVYETLKRMMDNPEFFLAL